MPFWPRARLEGRPAAAVCPHPGARPSPGAATSKSRQTKDCIPHQTAGLPAFTLGEPARDEFLNLDLFNRGSVPNHWRKRSMGESPNPPEWVGRGGFTKLYGFRHSLLTSDPYLVYFKCVANLLRPGTGGFTKSTGAGGQIQTAGWNCDFFGRIFAFPFPNPGSVREWRTPA